MGFLSSLSAWKEALLRPHYTARPWHLIERLWRRSPPDKNRVDVELPWGHRLTLDPHTHVGRILWTHRLYDPAVSEALWRLADPGVLHVDAGAHIGYATSLLARRAGESGSVASIEPHPDLLPLLKANVSNLSSDSGPLLHVYPLALSSQDGRCSLRWDASDSNLGRASVETGGADPGSKVQCRRLDTLFSQESIGVLKIDVEGHEAEVLKGALSSLSEGRIEHVVYESHQAAECSCHPILQRLGYAVFEIGWTPWAPAIWELGQQANGNRPASPAFLGTRSPGAVVQRFAARGWKCFAPRGF